MITLELLIIGKFKGKETTKICPIMQLKDLHAFTCGQCYAHYFAISANFRQKFGVFLKN
jgi:hypothetical protein